MNYSDQDIARQLRLGEDSQWEFKQIAFSGNRPTSPRRDDLADEIAAFANANGGVLLCGVTDEGEIQGLSREQVVELDAVLVEVSSDAIKPAVRISTYHRELDGKRFLLVEVPQGEAQHDSPGGSYVRVGGSKRRMTSDERLRLAQQRGQARFLCFDKQPVPDTGLGTLDEALWKPLLSAEGRIDPETALEKMGLLGRDEHGTMRATVAGLLFCSHTSEEWLPNACITATHYRGTDRASGQLDTQTIAGPLNRQIAEAVAFAVRNMRVGAYKDPARMDLPQYSAEALFEALTNAVAHRDYSIRGSRIRLSMFADRVEIQSPGALANRLTVDELEYRQATRNEVLASVFGRMPTSGIQGAGGRLFIMERRGDGVPIIRRETRELAGRLPRFDLVGGADLRVTLPAASTEPSPARVLITVRAGDQPLADAELLVLFPNKTWRQATTDTLGEAVVGLHTVNLPMTVFVAAHGFAAHCEQEWMPSEGALAVELKPLPDGGAAIFPEATGSLPGLKGSLNPKRDTLDRTYIYASNIAINQGEQQPVHFLPGEDLRLTDEDGTEMIIRIVDIVGRSALVEYRPFEP
ncbi:MAG: putative DNA binding domain-containing protein [Candidatus Latescibacteria bacterium]|nr:putative DNA binding domain-containing protein [Candidatus Latescibacterota bacterium]